MLEKWYKEIKDYTFYTEMIALPTDVAKAIVHAYHQFVYIQKRQQREMEEREREKGKGKKKKMTKEERMKEKRIAEKLMSKADRSLWAEDHAKVLVEFEETLDKAIRDFIEHHNGNIQSRILSAQIIYFQMEEIGYL